MSTAQAPDYSHIINGVYDVAGYHVGKSIVDVFRNRFTAGKIRTGDHLLSRSRPLIQQFYRKLPNNDQVAIYNEYQRAVGARERMESANGFRKFLKAREYEEVAKYLFIIVETASRRAADQNVMAQISEAIGTQPPPVGTTSTLSNPFSDSHEISSLAEVDVGDLNQVEMSIFESEATGQTAVVLQLQGRDGTTQGIAATIPLAAPVISGDGEDEGAERPSFDSVGRLYDSQSEADSEVSR